MRIFPARKILVFTLAGKRWNYWYNLFVLAVTSVAIVNVAVNNDSVDYDRVVCNQFCLSLWLSAIPVAIAKSVFVTVHTRIQKLLIVYPRWFCWSVWGSLQNNGLILVFVYSVSIMCSGVASFDNRSCEYSYIVFYIINLFWNLLFLSSVNTTIWIFAPPIINAGYATDYVG